MENVAIKFIECENLQIAASLEAISSEPHPIYYPSNVLFYIQKGQLNLKLEQQLFSIPKGSFALIRKYTHGQCFKTWTDEEGCAKMVAFVLQDDFLQKVIHNTNIKSEAVATLERVIHLPYNPLLKGLMDSIWAYIDGNITLERPLIELKTMEALIAIASARPDLIAVFKECSTPERANLESFMEHNFMYNVSLKTLAKMSGRSLSTFNREFKAMFKLSPHKWIKQQRLEMAKRLLVQTPKMASDIYLEVGFEDLAHFSRSFKQYFGVNPSLIKKNLP